MDIPTHDPKTWLNALWAGISAIGTLLLGLVLWNVKRAIATSDDHEKRLKELEQERVTKGDITALYERINDTGDRTSSQIDALGNRMTGLHEKVLDTIIRLKGE